MTLEENPERYADAVATLSLTEHEIRLIRRGLKALNYSLAKQLRKSTYVPEPGKVDVTAKNLDAVKNLQERIEATLKQAQRPEVER